MKIPVAILAGGLATRLRPLTSTLPKAMVDICGQPFLSHQLSLLRKQGLTDIVVCVGFEGKQIESYFGNGKDFGVDLTYSYDGDTLLGTGGALRQAFPFLGDVFMVLYGDSYLDIDYRPAIEAFLEQHQGNVSDSPLALMTVYQNEGHYDQSNVLFRQGHLLQYDKQHPNAEMRHIDWGLGILSKKAFSYTRNSGAFDLADLYQSLVSSKKLMGFEVFTRFYEMGSHQGLEELKALIKERKSDQA
ncbi:MAG: nucleotidyltransferase family protein [SAR324 cluster bacterium]|nr:nucleotidyltransferase family protein [SAR324 cluster bacterium]